MDRMTKADKRPALLGPLYIHYAYVANVRSIKQQISGQIEFCNSFETGNRTLESGNAFHILYGS